MMATAERDRRRGSGTAAAACAGDPGPAGPTAGISSRSTPGLLAPARQAAPLLTIRHPHW